MILGEMTSYFAHHLFRVLVMNSVELQRGSDGSSN